MLCYGRCLVLWSIGMCYIYMLCVNHAAMTKGGGRIKVKYLEIVVVKIKLKPVFASESCCADY